MPSNGKNRNQADIEMICKHLAEKLKIKFKFEENATPATNGSEITLPTNLNKTMLLEMLGALLHETFHIRHTNFEWFNNNYNYESPIIKEVVDVLENIRVDSRAIKKYPAAADLYSLLSKYVVDTHKDVLDKEPMPWKILKHLQLQNRATKEFPAPVYDPKAMELLSKLKLEDFSDQARAAHNTQDLLPIAKALLKKLLDYVEEQKQKQAGGGQPDFDTTQMSPQAAQQIQMDKIEQQSQKMQAVGQEMQSTRMIFAKQKNSAKQNNQWLRPSPRLIRKKNKPVKLNRTSKQAEADALDAQIDKAQAKLDAEKQQKLDEAQAKMDQLQKKESEATQKYQSMDTKKGEMLAKLQRITDNNNSMEIALGIESGGDMQGFDSIRPEDMLTQVDYNKDLELSRSLDERLRKFFIDEREERQRDEEGTRINNRKLVNLMTNNSGLFTIHQYVPERTDVIFLLDNSGSMDHKGHMLLSALNTLLTALKKVVVDENLPVDTAVYTFNDEPQCIQEFKQELDPDEISRRYRVGGGTRLLESVNAMHEVFENKGSDGKRLLVVVTDAEVNDYEIQTLYNEAHIEMKAVYIGICANLRSQEAQELFRASNITKEDEILDVLSSIIME